MKADIVFLHAPSVYDFREHSIMFGPVSDLVPSTPIFEMYPLGYPILAHYLENYGYKVRIVNLAYRMLKNPFFNVEKFISGLNTKSFGIDLHWLPHAHGSIEVAKIVKKHHPDKPIIFGGFSSTYFHEELIKYPQVDFVVKGDSTEEPLRMLLEALKNGGSFSSIPNLTWKDREGTIYSNSIDYVPSDLSHISLDYGFIMKSVIRYHDLLSYVPFVNWLDYPIVAALSCRGCTGNCVTCGGSKYTFKKFFNREEPAYRSPEMLADDIVKIQRYIRGPIFILGDMVQAGEDYACEFIDRLNKKNLKNKVAFEFFQVPQPSIIEKISRLKTDWSLEISIDSHDEEIRNKLGKKPFSNRELKDFIKNSIKLGCERFDLYFMTGLPFQSKESILKTRDFCDDLYQEIKEKKKLLVFTSPMAPFLDPGSTAFENPERFGYKILSKSLEDHREALLRPSWKHIMNYESKYLSKDDMVEATYEAAIGLNRIKARYGAIKIGAAEKVEDRIIKAKDILRRIDDIYCSDDESEKEKEFTKIKNEMAKYNMSTVCEKKELEWKSSFFFKFNMHRIISMMLHRD